MKRILIFLLSLNSLFLVTAQQDSTHRRFLKIDPATLPEFTLPVRVHDPVMIKQGDTYYLYTTGMGVEFQTSKDKKSWNPAGRVFPDGQLPAWHKDFIPDQNGHLWAPDIHFRDGKYHLYYSVSAWMNFNSSIGYATNTTLDPKDPNYNWVDHGCVISYKNGGDGVNVIDPNVFVDKDGKVWLLYGSYQAGLRLVELNPTTGLLKDETNPQLTVLTTTLGEGVFLLHSKGYYYVFASRGRCCAGLESTYQVVIGRSKDIHGPYLTKDGKSWKDNDYTLFLEGDEAQPGKGHNGFITENDTTFIVYHAYTRAANGTSLLVIRPMYEGVDGWPTLIKAKKLFRRDLW
jgi:arabinan endo-1,5-alpha-L-arabinosidase